MLSKILVQVPISFTSCEEGKKKTNTLLRVEWNPSDNKRTPVDSSQLLTRCRNQGYPSGDEEEKGNCFGYYWQVLLLCGNISFNYFKECVCFSQWFPWLLVKKCTMSNVLNLTQFAIYKSICPISFSVGLRCLTFLWWFLSGDLYIC